MNPKKPSQQILLVSNDKQFCSWLCAQVIPHTKIHLVLKSHLSLTLTEPTFDPDNLIILFYLKTTSDEKYALDVMLKQLQEFPRLKFFLVLDKLNLKVVYECLKFGSSALILKSEFEKAPFEIIDQIQKSQFILSPKLMNAMLEKFKQPMEELLKIKKLTPREIEVLDLIAVGYLNKEISKRLNISENTVKSLTYKIYKKLEVNNRVGAVRKYLNV